jgi:hypothetical protein
MKNDGFNDVYKMLKNSRTKLGAIPAARLEYEKETAAADVADRILPHLKMLSPQDIAMHPQWGVGLTLLQSLLAAKLMKNVSEEKKRNRAKASQLLDRAEQAELTEREKLNLLVKRMEERHEEKAKLEQEMGKANIAKAMAETKDIGSRAGLEQSKIDSKRERKEEEKAEKDFKEIVKAQVEQVKAFEKSMRPDQFMKALAAAQKGEFSSSSLLQRGKNAADILPMKTQWGTSGDRYRYKEGAPKGKVKVMLGDDDEVLNILG